MKHRKLNIYSMQPGVRYMGGVETDSPLGPADLKAVAAFLGAIDPDTSVTTTIGALRVEYVVEEKP